MVYVVYKICHILHLLNAPINIYIFTYNCDQMVYLPTFVPLMVGCTLQHQRWLQ